MLGILSKQLFKHQSALSGAAAVGRRCLQTESKSMLGSGGMGMASSVVEEAAAARMKKLDQAHTGQQRSTASRILGAFWNSILLGTTAAGGTAAYYTYAYDAKELGKIVDETRKTSEDNLLNKLWCDWMDRYIDLRVNLEAKLKDFTDPTYDKLLPDMPLELRGKVKTLVLDLDELLVHKEWTRQRGWTIYKRPGVQDFLLEMGQYFEIVIFTDEPNTYADPIISRLDTHKVVPYRLYRPETQYSEGKHVRDLSKLNRDLNQVLMISANPDAWKFQPENTLKLQPWTSDPTDTTLLDLIPFLQMIAMRGVKDVREVVKSYDGESDIPKAFKVRMQAAAEHQKQQKRGFLSLR